MTISVSNVRQIAWQKWQQLGLPNKKQERWKYTPLHNLKDIELVQTEKRQLTKRDLPQLIKHNYYQIVFQDGLYREDYSTLPQGVQFVKSTMPLMPNKQDNAFHALNTALATEQWQLQVPANTVLDKPIVLVNVVTDTVRDTHLALGIAMAASSQLRLIHYPIHLSTHKTLLTERVAIDLQANAKLDYCQYSPTSPQLNKMTMLHAALAQSAQFTHQHVDLASQVSRLELDVALNGEGAETTLQGIYYGQQTLHIDQYINIFHNASHTRSLQNYKGLAADKSTTVFNGAVHVAHGLQGIEAHQSNPNILLSNTASMNTKPELMIYSDDVQCSHGATVGELDETALFYLRSRGIPLIEAKQILINAFFADIINALPDDAFTTLMRESLTNLSGQDVECS